VHRLLPGTACRVEWWYRRCLMGNPRCPSDSGLAAGQDWCSGREPPKIAAASVGAQLSALGCSPSLGGVWLFGRSCSSIPIPPRPELDFGGNACTSMKSRWGEGVEVERSCPVALLGVHLWSQTCTPPEPMSHKPDPLSLLLLEIYLGYGWLRNCCAQRPYYVLLCFMRSSRGPECGCDISPQFREKMDG
jgi:hypothetical protein